MKNHTANDKRIEALALLKQAANAPVRPSRGEYETREDDLTGSLSHSMSSMKQRKHTNTTELKKNTYLLVEQKNKNATKLVSRAMELFEKAGTAGSRVGWYNLGHLLWTGFPPLLQQNDNDNENENNTDDVVGEMEGDDPTVVTDDTSSSQIVPTNKKGNLGRVSKSH